MIENPLKVAHEAVQDRKEACGMPELQEILDGERGVTHAGEESVGIWSGTDLLEGQAFEAAQNAARVVMAMIVRGDVSLPQGLMSVYVEALLVGIEHGRRTA